MSTIQLIQVTPDELVNLITKGVKTHLDELSARWGTIPQQTQKELLTRKETQALFQVSSVTIHEWQKNGILKVYKLGNRSYFRYSELLETLYKSNRL